MVISAIGCGSDPTTPHPVHGQVIVDGQPAELATVVFHPINNAPEEVASMRPRAVTDKEGRFVLATYDVDDGIPAGEYKATVVWPGPPPSGDPDSYHPDELRSRPDVLRGRYANPETSDLQVTVSQGENELPPWELKTK